MANMYFYKLTGDSGGAPCVTGDLLTLAICKPMIRRKAEIGDLIFGFAANSLYKDNSLIYVACVTGKLSDGKYYKDSEYAKRSDCIYTFEAGRYFWRSGSLHDELLRLKDWIWQNNQKMKIGEPTSKPSRSKCHRGKSCGVVKK